jgi:hypothetical protein
MKEIIRCLIIATVSLGLSGFSLAQEVKSIQSKITNIFSDEKQIGLKSEGESIKISINEGTKISKAGKDIEFSDLSTRNKVKVLYVKEDDLLGFGEMNLAKEITVIKQKTEGTGIVSFVEPETKSISVVIDDTHHIFGITKDTILKGVKGLKDIKKNDKVFVDYKINEDRQKILVVLEKKSS